MVSVNGIDEVEEEVDVVKSRMNSKTTAKVNERPFVQRWLNIGIVQEEEEVVEETQEEVDVVKLQMNWKPTGKVNKRPFVQRWLSVPT